MRFLFRVLLLFLVVSAVLSVIRSAFQPAQPAPRRPRTEPEPEPESPPEPERRGSSSHLVKDPVCGTYIPESTALRERNAFFCSEDCRRKYLAG